jgi:hypothetical protein
MKELCLKLALNLTKKVNKNMCVSIANTSSSLAQILGIIDLIESLQIRAVGFLDCMDPDGSFDGGYSKVLVALLGSLPAQTAFIRSKLVIIKLAGRELTKSYSCESIDLRSVTELKRTDETIEILGFNSNASHKKIWRLKSVGYSLNLDSWFELIESEINLVTGNGKRGFRI